MFGKMLLERFGTNSEVPVLVVVLGKLPAVVGEFVVVLGKLIVVIMCERICMQMQSAQSCIL